MNFSKIPPEYVRKFSCYTITTHKEKDAQKLIDYFVEKGQWNKKAYNCPIGLYSLCFKLYMIVNTINHDIESPEKFVNFVDDFVKTQWQKYDTCIKIGTMTENDVKNKIGMDLVNTIIDILK